MTDTQRTIHEQLEHLAQMSANWDSYGAPPITREAVEAARTWLLRLYVWPRSNGGITLGWDEMGQDVQIAPDGTFEICECEQGVRVSPERAAPPSDKRVSEIRALVDSYELDPARDAMGLPAGYGVVRLDLLRELLDMVRISPIPSSAAVEAALGKLNLPQPSYWVSGTDNLRPPRPNVEEALRAAYAVDRGAAPAGDAP